MAQYTLRLFIIIEDNKMNNRNSSPGTETITAATITQETATLLPGISNNIKNFGNDLFHELVIVNL